jgi:hypothetical protein
MQALQSYLRDRSMPGFSLPVTLANPPTIEWAGALTAGATAATSLANGVVVPASSPLLSGPIREQFTASLPGSPTVGGLPCLAVNRLYSCKGQARSVSSRTILRFRTDAPVIELSGAIPEGSPAVQTLIVDGMLVPPKALSCSRGAGGWIAGTLRIEFGSRVLRDIWIETYLAVAYVKIAQQDVLLAADDQHEPQLTAVGDSYLQSRSATFANGGAIALEIGARLGIRKVATDSIGGTGYHNSGGNLGNLNDRLPAHSADKSIVYLVLAGLNDYGDIIEPPQLVWPSRTTYEQAVQTYLQNLRLAQPKSLIVVTAPFCPVPSMSDATYVANAATNSSGLGDFAYRAQVHKSAVQQLAAPWVYIDVLMGGGWLNSSGATGDSTGLQWLTGGTAAPGTTATHRPGNTNGGGGGGFGGISKIPVLGGGHYSQAPDIVASGGSGQGLLLASTIDNAGRLNAITIVQPGFGYTESAGLPAIAIDATWQITAAALGAPELIMGSNPDGVYPLPSFAPSGATNLNNIYTLLMADQTHPSPLGVEYLSTRLAKSIHEAVMAL